MLFGSPVDPVSANTRPCTDIRPGAYYARRNLDPDTEAEMYAMGAYFLEVFPNSIPGGGWTAEARFSRRDDYRRHSHVPVATFPSPIVMPTRGSAETAAVAWAREFVASSGDVVESSLDMAGLSGAPYSQ
jgi:hypothetical protein